MNRPFSINGIEIEKDVDRDRRDELWDTHSRLSEVRGLGYQRAAELMGELGSADDILDAGVDRIAALDGFGDTSARRVIQHLRESRDGWQGEVPLKVSYDPENDRPYTVSIGHVYSQRGNSLKPALIDAAESASKQKLLDALKSE